jgi:hypothetical protein
VFHRSGLLCNWVFANHNDFFSGEESLCCLFLCGVVGMKFADRQSDGMETTRRNR